jgi:isocitrate dehydrogenase
MTTTITLIPGDGIGPEVVEAARRIIDATGIALSWEVCEAGRKSFERGISTGVPQETLDSIARNRVALKGPLETPIGCGEKSANVTLRKLFDTYANIRPIRSFQGVPTPFADRQIDCVIVRENIEDLYAGIEYQTTPDVAQALKVMSWEGCARIVRLAFEFARAERRTKVHCATKANILKMTEGLLKRVFETIAPEYPDIESHHIIVDNCAHQMVRFPERFDVVVMSNMNGDILSDMASGLIGGLGFAPGANIGHEVSIFEAVHGSAPRYAGQNTINPTAVILSGVMMLRHLKAFEAASRIESALHATLAKGLRTRDVPGTGEALSTSAFTDAIIKEMHSSEAASSGRITENSRIYRPMDPLALRSLPPVPLPAHQRHIGVDVGLSFKGAPAVLGQACAAVAQGTPFRFVFLDSRGFVVYPSSGREVACTSHWRARFLLQEEGTDLTPTHVFDLLKKLMTVAPWNQFTWLDSADDKVTFTPAQGE